MGLRTGVRVGWAKPAEQDEFPKQQICQLVNFVDGAELRDLAESPEPELAELADLVLAWRKDFCLSH